MQLEAPALRYAVLDHYHSAAEYTHQQTHRHTHTQIHSTVHSNV